MPRLSDDQWRDLKSEFQETDLNFTSLSEKYGIDVSNISRRAAREGWEKRMAEADRAEKLAGAGKRRADLVIRHREEWNKIDTLQSFAFRFEENDAGDISLVISDFNVAKLAKISAETLEIKQRGERRAWGLDNLVEYQLSEQQMGRRRELIQDMIDGKIEAFQAAAYMEMDGIPIPESISAILKRTPVQEKEPELQEIPTAELDREYQETLRDIHEQKTKWLPEREAEIRAAKEEAGKKDVFVSRDKTDENSEYFE